MTESLSRITSMFESAKDLTIEAAVSASSRLADTPTSSRPQEIVKLLNSRTEKDVLNGMKCVITMISRGEDGSPYFADIVKNVTSANSKVRNLVLIYLTRYAEMEPDKALLSINSIQKLLDSKSPVVRANSIKSLSGIRISTLSPILLVCIKRTVGDKSPLVRASTAMAIGKVYAVDKTSGKQLLGYLHKLLADVDAQVVAAAIKTYSKITKTWESPTKKWGIIHGHFKRYCRILNEFDEWAQACTIDLLTDYCRLFIKKPVVHVGAEEANSYEMADPADLAGLEYTVTFDDDLHLFLNSLKPLLYSDSEFVILSIVRSLMALSPPLIWQEFDLPSILCGMFAHPASPQIGSFVLQTIAALIAIDKSLFSANYRQFFIYPSDTAETAKLKLELLSLLVNQDNIKYIIEELKYNAINSKDASICGDAMKAIGRCAGISDEWNEKILKWSVKNIKSASGESLNELLTVIRYLIQVQQQISSGTHVHNEHITKIVFSLSLVLTDANFQLDSNAKASIIWIIGEFTKECDNKIAPDVLRVLLKSLTSETQAVRYQTLVLAAKLFSTCLDDVKRAYGEDSDAVQDFKTNGTISKMFNHTLALCKYDASYDTRDRARMFNVLFNSGNDNSQLGSLFLQVPKSVPLFSSLVANNTHNKVLHEFLQAPEWADPSTLPAATIRKEAAVEENKLNTVGIGSNLSTNAISKRIGELPSTVHAVSSASYQKAAVNKPTYQLQSLDEFFGSEEDSESSEEESEDSSDSDEADEGDGTEESEESGVDSDAGEEEDDTDDSTRAFIQ